jgi:hypothetical protein
MRLLWQTCGGIGPNTEVNNVVRAEIDVNVAKRIDISKRTGTDALGAGESREIRNGAVNRCRMLQGLVQALL